MKRKAVLAIYSKFEEKLRIVANQNDISYRKTKRVVNDLVQYLIEMTENGETVTIPKLGTFSYQHGMIFTKNS